MFKNIQTRADKSKYILTRSTFLTIFEMFLQIQTTPDRFKMFSDTKRMKLNFEKGMQQLALLKLYPDEINSLTISICRSVKSC